MLNKKTFQTKYLNLITNTEITHKKYVLDDPYVYQSDNIVEETFEDFLQYFHRYK